MNKREASIVSAYTGYLIGEFSDMHEYVEEILHRPVWTHELSMESIIKDIHEKSKEDFINIKVLHNEDVKKDLINPILDEISMNCEGCMRNSNKCIEEECALFRIEKIIEDWRNKNG